MSRQTSAAEHPGQLIRRERERQGLSREGLAFKAGVSLRAIERIEAKENPTFPRRATLRVIVDALGLDPADFNFYNGEAA